MRIHSDVLTIEHVNAAADEVPGVHLHKFSEHGSRRRDHTLDVFLVGHGKTGGQWGAPGGLKTASWDDWGMVLARLYIIDPLLWTRQYPDRREFNTYTADRFMETRHQGAGLWAPVVFDPDPIHHAHRWEFEGISDTGGSLFSCKGSKAINCIAGLDVPRGARR